MSISLIRTIILYAIVVVAIRVMGKRQIGEMQASELVVTLMISDLATLPMQNTGTPILYGVIPILCLVLIEVVLSFLMLKFPWFRNKISGNPVVIIKDGVIIQKAMRMIRFTNEDLQEELRKSGIFDISTVQYAIVETDGILSFYQYPEEQPLTPKTAGIEILNNGISVVIVSDGQISEHSFPLCNKNLKWVENTLKKEKIDLKDVFLLTCDKSNNYNIVRKEQ